jgi:hypothetical protein
MERMVETRMEPVAHKSRSFEEAKAWDLEQRRRMSPDERQGASKVLRERAYGTDPPDIHEAERSR